MKTKNTLKSVILSIIILTAVACKKEETKPQPKLCIIEYMGTISGANVKGAMSYYDPSVKKLVTDSIVGNHISRTITMYQGQYTTVYVSAEGPAGVMVSAKAEIYVDNAKQYSDVDVNTMFANASADGVIN